MNLHDVSFPEEIVPLHPMALEGVFTPHPGKLETSSPDHGGWVGQHPESTVSRQDNGRLDVGGLAGDPGIDPDLIQEVKEG